MRFFVQWIARNKKKNKKHGSQCGKIENKKPHNLRGGVDTAEK